MQSPDSECQSPALCTPDIHPEHPCDFCTLDKCSASIAQKPIAFENNPGSDYVCHYSVIGERGTY